MSLSGMILKKVHNIEIDSVKEKMDEILSSLGYLYSISRENGTEKYYIYYVSEYLGSNSEFIMYIYDKSTFVDKQFEWIDKEIDIVILIEDIFNCEDMILKILHKYFKLYPNDYFYNELEWYYQKKDIDKIYESNN